MFWGYMAYKAVIINWIEQWLYSKQTHDWLYMTRWEQHQSVRNVSDFILVCQRTTIRSASIRQFKKWTYLWLRIMNAHPSLFQPSRLIRAQPSIALEWNWFHSEWACCLNFFTVVPTLGPPGLCFRNNTDVKQTSIFTKSAKPSINQRTPTNLPCLFPAQETKGLRNHWGWRWR